MRTPDNPVKVGAVRTAEFKRHRLIMPVYIPSTTGYYQDALRIFHKCLESLLRTAPQDTIDITIVDNASIPDVRAIVEPHLASNRIDQYVRNSLNRGKADAIVGQARACYEPFITMSDADVLFLPGWLDAVEQVYAAFPDAGVVCPFPTPNLRHHFCTSTWLNHLFTARPLSVVKESSLRDLVETIGAPELISKKDFETQWCITRRGATALVGAGHFVATYRRSVFDQIRYAPQRMGLKGGLRNIEQQVDRMGLSRLSCPENHVLHMGNAWESWMENRERGETIGSFVGAQPALFANAGIIAKILPHALRPFVAKTFIAYDKFRRPQGGVSKTYPTVEATEN